MNEERIKSLNLEKMMENIVHSIQSSDRGKKYTEQVGKLRELSLEYKKLTGRNYIIAGKIN